MKDKKQNYFIVAVNSETDFANFSMAEEKTEHEMKRELAAEVRRYKDGNLGKFDFGTTNLKDIRPDGNGVLTAEAVFDDFHVTIYAAPVERLASFGHSVKTNKEKEKETKNGWISTKDRLPDDEEQVLVARRFLGVRDVPPSTYVEIAQRVDDSWCADSDEYKISISRHTDPFAWMPLPEPPEFAEDKNVPGSEVNA